MTAAKQEPLTIDDVCRLSSDLPLDASVPTNERRRMIDRLKALERKFGIHVLHGGGQGARYWTTRAALRTACPGLIDRDERKLAELERKVQEHEAWRERVEARLRELTLAVHAVANDGR